MKWIDDRFICEGLCLDMFFEEHIVYFDGGKVKSVVATLIIFCFINFFF